MKATRPLIHVADHFCGAGGTSTGIAEACEELGLPVNLIAINHWQVAINTHAAAHPWATHICQELQMVKPREAVPTGRLHLLAASPECTNHSIAKGGRPKDEQSRATGWDVLKWIQELYVDNIMLENVKEWRKWGPLGADLKPLKSKEGDTFRAFLDVMKSLGYRVEHRVLNCADFGAPTSRERLFILARRQNKSISWPAATHSRTGTEQLFGSMLPYRTARSIIDWTIPNPSIFTRKRPLKPNTMRRIIAGLEKVNPHLAPFLVHLRNNCDFRSLDTSVPTITAGGRHLGLCEPVILGQQSGAAVDEVVPTIATAEAISLTEAFITTAGGATGQGRTAQSLDKPLGTVLTNDRRALCQPVLVTVNHGDGGLTRLAHSVDNPTPTLTTKNGLGMAEAIVLPMNRAQDAARSVDNPLRTVTATSNDMGLAEAIIVPQFGERPGQSPRFHRVEDPLPAVTSHGAGALVESIIIPIDNKSSGPGGGRSTDQPLSTITTENRHALAEAFLTKYYGTATTASVDEPLDTVTTRERFGLVQFEINGESYALDIRFRMLQPHELAAAMTFPNAYPFTGNKSEQTKQIGNAVPPLMGKVLALELLGEFAGRLLGAA